MAVNSGPAMVALVSTLMVIPAVNGLKLQNQFLTSRGADKTQDFRLFATAEAGSMGDFMYDRTYDFEQRKIIAESKHFEESVDSLLTLTADIHSIEESEAKLLARAVHYTAKHTVTIVRLVAFMSRTITDTAGECVSVLIRSLGAGVMRALALTLGDVAKSIRIHVESAVAASDTKRLSSTQLEFYQISLAKRLEQLQAIVHAGEQTLVMVSETVEIVTHSLGKTLESSMESVNSLIESVDDNAFKLLHPTKVRRDNSFSGWSGTYASGLMGKVGKYVLQKRHFLPRLPDTSDWTTGNQQPAVPKDIRGQKASIPTVDSGASPGTQLFARWTPTMNRTQGMDTSLYDPGGHISTKPAAGSTELQTPNALSAKNGMSHKSKLHLHNEACVKNTAASKDTIARFEFEKVLMRWVSQQFQDGELKYLSVVLRASWVQKVAHIIRVLFEYFHWVKHVVFLLARHYYECIIQSGAYRGALSIHLIQALLAQIVAFTGLLLWTKPISTRSIGQIVLISLLTSSLVWLHVMSIHELTSKQLILQVEAKTLQRVFQKETWSPADMNSNCADAGLTVSVPGPIATTAQSKLNQEEGRNTDMELAILQDNNIHWLNTYLSAVWTIDQVQTHETKHPNIGGLGAFYRDKVIASLEGSLTSLQQAHSSVFAIKLKHLTLGRSAPVLTKVRTYPKIRMRCGTQADVDIDGLKVDMVDLVNGAKPTSPRSTAAEEVEAELAAVDGQDVCESLIMDIHFIYVAPDLAVEFTLRQNDVRSMLPEASLQVGNITSRGVVRLQLQLLGRYPFFGNASVSLPSAQ
jgi:hypothetical protein